MSEQNRQDDETLSALMDNEADDLELRRVLKSCARQPELLATWERYHLAQSVLHRSARAVSPDLAGRIATQIASEATPSTRLANSPAQAPASSNWQHSLAKIAIAASVAIIFIVTVPGQFSSDDTPSVVQQQTISPPQAQPQNLLATDTTPAELDPVSTQFLRDYLEHMRIDDKEPAITVHIKDSPLFQLVNQVGVPAQ